MDGRRGREGRRVDVSAADRRWPVPLFADGLHPSGQVRPPGTPGLCARLLFPGLKAPSASLGTGSDFCRPAFGLAPARLCFAGVFVRGCGCCVCRCDLSQSSPMRACLGHPPAVGYRRSFDCGWRFAPTFAQEGSYLFFMDWCGMGGGRAGSRRHPPAKGR